ncbi:MAG: hypothetical protein CM1200mP27_10410 [Chloroflexota bacterium]|nr:MAG: hypothetical protein CM1200mP27_10410 [Chloroflexota bacterium]
MRSVPRLAAPTLADIPALRQLRRVKESGSRLCPNNVPGPGRGGWTENQPPQLFGSKPIVLTFGQDCAPLAEPRCPTSRNLTTNSKTITAPGIDLGQFTGLGNADDAKSLLSELGATYPAGFTSDQTYRELSSLGHAHYNLHSQNGDIFNKWTGALNSSILKEKALEM